MNLDLMLADKEHEDQREAIKDTVRALNKVGITDQKQIFDILLEQHRQTFEPSEIKELIQEVEDEKINK